MSDIIHFIGIDPGVSGGIAWTSPLGDQVKPMPATLHDTITMLESILDSQADEIAEAMVAGALGQSPIQILGQSTPAQSMGLGMYQSEPVADAGIMGVTPYTGHFG